MDAVFGAPPGRVGAASLPAATTPDFEPLPDIEPLPGSSQETASTTAQLLNVRVELTLIEEGDGAGAPKRVSMLLADQQQGRLRSSGAAPASHLNVDARPEVASDGRIRLFLSLDYRRDNTGTGLTQSLHTLLDNGKPLQVSQSPDPKSERAVRLEVTATIVK